MYESYWQLESMPFENTADARFFFATETHQGVLLKLRYAVENGRGAAMLAAEAGLGKSLIIQTLMRQLDDRFTPRVHLVFPQMPPDQLMAYLAESLSGVRQSEPEPAIQRSVRLIEATLAKNADAGRHALVVIDEAQDLHGTETLETVRLLLNFEHDARMPLTVLLIGQPDLIPMLEDAPELDERLAVKCMLRCLTREETCGYVTHRLTTAGSTKDIFEQEALEAVYHLSQGVPRRINRLCDLALLVGFADERATIGPEQIKAVAQELVVVGTADVTGSSAG